MSLSLYGNGNGSQFFCLIFMRGARGLGLGLAWRRGEVGARATSSSFIHKNKLFIRWRFAKLCKYRAYAAWADAVKVASDGWLLAALRCTSYR
jgi:hypothetical protein